MAYDVPGTADATTPGSEAQQPQQPPTTCRENGTTRTKEPFFLSVRGEAVEEVRPLWTRLRDGATIIEEFGPSQWAPASGMLYDRFGITWILDVAG